MKSARNQFILIGFLCQGLAWDSWLYWIVAIGLWALALGPWRPKIQGGPNLELGALIVGSAASIAAGKALGQSSHFFLGDGVLLLQIARMFRPLSRREKFASVLIACFHLAVACTLAPNLSFLLLGLAALILLPKALVELQSEEFNTNDSALDWTLLAPLAITAVAVFVCAPRFAIGGPMHLSGASSAGGGLLNSVLDPSGGGRANSAQVLMQVEGKNLRYFKCMALSKFDGQQWQVDERVTLRPFQRRIPETDLAKYPVRRIRVKSVSYLGRVLPTDGVPVALQGKFFSKPLMNSHGAVECVSLWNTANNFYEYWIHPEPPAQPLSAPLIRYYTQHPQPSTRLSEFMSKVTAGATNQLEAARRLEKYLQRHYAYRIGAPALRRVDSLEEFLFEKREGHCERFASALALLLRMHNIPTRIAIGYVPGPNSRFSDWRQIRFKDAHAWTEAWFPELGWTTFDATPGGGMDGHGWGVTEFFEGLDLVWYSRVVSFDRESQRQLMAGLMGAMMSIPGIVNRNLAIFFVLLAAGFVPWIYRQTRGSRTGAGLKRSNLPTANHFYARMLRALARRGFDRPPEQTPVEFLESLREAKAPCLAEIGEVTRAFCDSKYGEQPLPEVEVRRLGELLERVENAPEIVR
jgi:transglutaminase-like putative cysteine protease